MDRVKKAEKTRDDAIQQLAQRPGNSTFDKAEAERQAETMRFELTEMSGKL